MIHNFKSYTPLKLLENIGYIPCAVQYILVAYFMHNSLYLLIPYPYTVPPSFPLPTGNCKLVLYICEPVSFLLQSRVFIS